jgi:hypothetical protein
MFTAMIGRFLAAVLLYWGISTASAHAQSATYRADVVVELYTSQGCVQCPRGNRLLGMFSREERILGLTLPVGIWDYLGWIDTFAQPEFTDRQRIYSRSLRGRGRFTPQLVINGAMQMSAYDWDEARAELDRARTDAPLSDTPDISITRLGGGRVRVTLGSGPRRSNVDVWLATFDPGPIAIFVAQGVNANRRIYHYNLVRSFDRMGAWNGGSVWYERAGCAPECAVIVQEPNGGPIIAAAFTAQEP